MASSDENYLLIDSNVGQFIYLYKLQKPNYTDKIIFKVIDRVQYISRLKNIEIIPIKLKDSKRKIFVPKGISIVDDKYNKNIISGDVIKFFYQSNLQEIGPVLYKYLTYDKKAKHNNDKYIKNNDNIYTNFMKRNYNRSLLFIESKYNVKIIRKNNLLYIYPKSFNRIFQDIGTYKTTLGSFAYPLSYVKSFEDIEYILLLVYYTIAYINITKNRKDCACEFTKIMEAFNLGIRYSYEDGFSFGRYSYPRQLLIKYIKILIENSKNNNSFFNM